MSPLSGYDSDLFPGSDGVPVESEWHDDEMALLKDVAWHHYRDRDDVYIGGDMCMYYDPNDPRKMVGPDFFFVRGVRPAPRRRIWAAWVEGRLPDVIIELLSPTTKHKDRKTNKDIYERTFRTAEYDRDGRLLPTPAEAARQQTERERRRAERARRKAEREHELVEHADSNASRHPSILRATTWRWASTNIAVA